jgi:translation initiation factor 1
LTSARQPAETLAFRPPTSDEWALTQAARREGAVAKRGDYIDPEAKASPFAGLAALRDVLPTPGSAPAPAAPASGSAPGPAAPARAVLRLERKGHGGRDTTRVSHLGLSPEALADWLHDAKKALGCGGAIEAADLLFQGDLRDRLAAWLTRRGVRRITR